jgi:hypothetical protein
MCGAERSVARRSDYIDVANLSQILGHLLSLVLQSSQVICLSVTPSNFFKF